MSAARRMGLRARFLLACGLLVMTTVVSSAWTLAVLARLTASARALVHQSDEASAALEDAASSLEREDDALLLVLSSDDHSQASLPAARQRVDNALNTLARILAQSGEAQLGQEAVMRVAAYREAVRRLLAEPLGPDPLDQYHRIVNPPLRLAIAAVARIRDRFFDDLTQGLTRSRDAVVRTRGVVFVIAATSLVVAVGVALRLAREVIGPLRQLAQGANAIREGNFDARILRAPGDEIAEVADAFNLMAERLVEFRRVNLEEILRVKATLEATLSALPDAIVLLDADGHILSANPAGEALLPTLDGLRPRQAGDLVKLGLGPDVLQEVIAGRAAPSAEVNLASALRFEVQGEVRRLLARIARTGREPDGRCGVVLILSDVTELARLDELRAEHIAVASHELRTPVTTLRMTLLLLSEVSGGLPQRIRDLVSTALVGVEQLSERVDEMLDLARIEAGRLELLREPLDVTALAAEAIKRAQQRAEDADVKLLLHLKSGVPQVRGDRARLRIVLDNLLSNALKYTPMGGAVSVQVSQAEGMGRLEARAVRLEVSDNGPGIPADLRVRVFEKFFRVESHRQSARRGTYGAGIGLFLCKQIVELHAGRIYCESGPDEQGTRMVIELPEGEGALEP